MTLRHFRIFISVCQEKSMTKAAEKMYMTQPSVTQAVKELEEHYGTKLFERIGKKINITKQGYALISIAENIITLFEEAERAMKEKAELFEVNIGASVTVGTYILSRVIKEMYECGKKEIKYKIDNTKNIEKMILESEIDVGIVEGEINSKVIKCIPVIEDELVFVCEAGRFEGCDSIGVEELGREKFILREEGSGTKAMIESMLYQKNIKIDVVGRVNNIEAIKNMVINGIGVSILPKISVTREEAEGVVKCLKIRELKLVRMFKVAYHKDKIINKELEKLIEICKNMRS